MEKAWIYLKYVLIRYPEHFGVITESHKELFYWSYEFIMTRCFGWLVNIFS